MKKLIPVLVLAFAAVSIFSCTNANKKAKGNIEEGLTWLSWEEAVKANQKKPKKFIVDVYTDWCGWCKRMDQTTFSDPKVQAYLSKHFYAVKLDAEQKKEITFDGNTFNFVPSGRRGYHQLAYALLDGRLSYPSIVYLNEKVERITVSPGYKTAEDIMPELTFVADEHYKNSSFQDYKSRSK